MKKSCKYSGRKLKKPDLPKEGMFTQIPNAFILNPDIGNSELRLLQFIMMSKDGWTIKTDDCIKYLCKTKQAIYPLFEKLIKLGILDITDETIEVIIPEEMKKYKLGYLKSQENFTTEVKKTSPTNSEETNQNGQKNLTTEVKKTLPSSQENLTSEVKKTYKKPLESINNDNVTDPIILYNTTRVLPVPAKSGSTEQTHSNDNTKGNTGIELDLECDALQSLASPTVLAPSLHTPKGEDGSEDNESSLPIGEDNSEVIPFEDDTLPTIEDLPQTTVETKPVQIEPDKRFAEQVEIYNTSKYFLPEKLSKVKSLYISYAEQYPNEYMSIAIFEIVLIYLMTATLAMVKRNGINNCLLVSLRSGTPFT